HCHPAGHTAGQRWPSPARARTEAAPPAVPQAPAPRPLPATPGEGKPRTISPGPPSRLKVGPLRTKVQDARRGARALTSRNDGPHRAWLPTAAWTPRCQNQAPRARPISPANQTHYVTDRYVESGIVSSRSGPFFRALAIGRQVDGWYRDATSRVKLAVCMPGQQLPATPQALMLVPRSSAALSASPGR